MRLMVTGAAGFIGSNFVRHWISERPDDHIVAYDLLTYAGNEPNLSDVRDRIVFVQGDIGEIGQVEKVLDAEEIDTIVNFAAESHNSYAVIDPALFFRTNAMGTLNLLEAARSRDIGRFHHISTCEVYGDLPLDTDEMFTESSPYRPRTPYNASKAAADHAVIDPALFFRTNAMGTLNLLEAARSRDIGRFHHISTCEVYGDLPLDTDEIFTESSPYRPRTPYNASKAAADHAVRAYHETYGLRMTITNCANNYGPYQFPEKVIPVFTTNALNDEPLPLYASTQNRREWIHVLDHCRGIMRVILDGRIGETYNIGTGVERSIEEIADGVLDALGKPKSLKTIVPDRPGHDRRYVLDWTKIRTELGWAPEIDFEEGLRDTVRWYAEHRTWWEPLLGRRPVEEAEAWK